MNYFAKYGGRLLSNGYLILPIAPGQKRPPVANWQHSRYTSSDLGRFPGHGLGILTGQGDAPVIAIDIDCMFSDVTAELVAWCHKHIGYTPARVGKAPKALLVYRGPRGFRKWTGPWFADPLGGKHRVEILGEGQQFVAYAIHPDTKAEYEWQDLTGDGIADIAAQDLPEFNEHHLAAFAVEVQRVMLDRGLTPIGPAKRTVEPLSGAGGGESEGTDDPMMVSRPLGLTAEEIDGHLVYFDAEDYDTWLQVGMALHHETQGGPEGLALWDGWSCSASNYAGEDDLAKRWAGFRITSKSRTMRWVIKIANRAREDEEKRGREDLRAALRDAVEAVADVETLRVVAAAVGAETKGDQLLRAEMVSRVHHKMGELGSKVPIAEVRALLSGDSASAASREWTERGNAQRMMDAHGRGLMYVRELDRWFRWSGVRWQEAHHLDIEQMAQSTLDNLWKERDGIADTASQAAFVKFAVRSQTKHMVEAMCGLAKSEASMLRSVANLDADSNLFGVGNGVVDLRTGILHDPHPDQFVTLGTDIEYDVDATAPLWDATLLDVFAGDFGMVSFFQRLVGYMMSGQPNEHILVIPYGNGANGKSTIFGVLQQVFGRYCRTASADSFTTSRPGGSGGGAPREDLLRLRDARMVLVGEPEEDTYLRESLVKTVTGQDVVVARGIHAKNSAEFVPTWVPVMSTNHRPVIKGEDHGIWRRLMAIPFLRNFDTDPAVEKDLYRAQKLRKQLPGVLNWCVEGARQYAKMGLQVPTEVTAAKESYRETMDVLSEWVETRCEVGATCRATTAELWASWEAFARNRGELRLIPSARSLGKRLANRFLSLSWRAESGQKVRGWGGIGLLTVSEDE